MATDGRASWGAGGPYNYDAFLVTAFPCLASQSPSYSIPKYWANSRLCPALSEDPWINSQSAQYDLSELEGTAIAVDATYYLQLFLDNPPFHEPLLPALGGLTGIQNHITKDLDQWAAAKIVPFMIFDGQPIKGQEELATRRALQAVDKTDKAWRLYFSGQAEQAVQTFGANGGAYRTQALYPLLQNILRERGLHFLVPPYNSAAQIAYFDMIDSDQCAGIMGSQELLLYPIKDCVIRSIDWENKTVSAISRKSIVKTLNVSESMFIDALLMTGTSFLPTFPALLDHNINPRQPFTITDAINMLRTSEKSVTNACAAFNDILTREDPNWLDKYHKARMAVHHFIYISEEGEAKVNDAEHLTGDNHEYLGLQLPLELFHYLNRALISPRVLSWITHSQIIIQPTLDGEKTTEYKNLITKQLVPLKEKTIGLIIPPLHRGLQHKDITLKVWFDEKYSHTIYHGNIQSSSSHEAASWNVKEATIRSIFPGAKLGSLAFEVTALQNPKLVAQTIAEPKTKIKGLDSADIVCSVALWRFLHLREYVDGKHELTIWGKALATAMSALTPTVEMHPEIPNLYESILIAFELIRFELLNSRNRHEELHGLPINGTEDDKSAVLLISRCATLLKLRHEANGYTGPLSKNLLTFHSLSQAVREANRDLLETVLATMFLCAQSKRDREDYLEISHRLPFTSDPDVALGIAVKTFLDELPSVSTLEERQDRALDFPTKFVPFAIDFMGDLKICFAFVEALYKGVKTLDQDSTPIATIDRNTWDKTHKYIESRTL
ncbi:putative xpg domain-containing protein [Zalerion maritima]|uniref:Xpg domain-containing protein n=1 Tax=Zalerion maritima TaxID=339359 RepID=A0AAD5RTV5_9PEZI|nr:putative xpg domain-containing protein [Zalerion maritima]